MATDDPDFLHDLDEALGDRIRADYDFACRVWGSLANVEWQHRRATFGASFRGAGKLLAEMRGNLEPHNYMDFYCSVEDRTVDPEVAEALAPLGWHGETDTAKWRPFGEGERRFA